MAGWIIDQIRAVREDTDITVISGHWGPNMVGRPVPHVRRAASDVVVAGATLVAGHSAHVFRGLTRHVLYDLGDFLDDYATHSALRNDLGPLWPVTPDESELQRLEAVPIALGSVRSIS